MKRQRPGVEVLEGRCLPSASTMFALGAGPGGGPRVQVFSDATGTPVKVADFFAFDPSFTGGVNVAVGDLDGDGTADLVVGAGPGGGPEVKVYHGLPGGIGDSAIGFNLASPIDDFLAYGRDFTGGVRVAVGLVAPSVGGSVTGYLVTGAGPGGGPHVKVFLATAGVVNPNAPLASFMAYTPDFTGGVSVAAGSLTDSALAAQVMFAPPKPSIRVVTGAGPGGGPHVQVFDGTLAGLDPATPSFSFFAFNPAFTGGVNVATRTSAFLDNPFAVSPTSSTDFLVSAGPGGRPEVRVFAERDLAAAGTPTPTPTFDFVVGDPSFTGGLTVTGVFAAPFRPLSQQIIGLTDNVLQFGPVQQILVGFGPGSSNYQLLRLDPAPGPGLTPDTAPVTVFAGTFDPAFLGGVLVG